MPKASEKFIIHTGRPGWVIYDLEADPEYAELVKAEKDKTLSDKFPRDPISMSRKARNYHTMEMLQSPGVEKYVADNNGTFVIDNEQDAKNILAEAKVLNPKSYLDTALGSDFGDKITHPRTAKKK